MLSILEYEKKVQDLKTELDSFRPFNQSQLKNLQERFRIWFTFSSNAIEGNTLNQSEVKVLIEDGITIAGKTIKELKETINHAKLLNNLSDLFEKNTIQISEEFVCWLHQELMDWILEENERGKRRSIQVFISGSEEILPTPDKLDSLMKNFFSEIESDSINPLQKIAKIHYDFVKIHPFTDGNWRIARLLMNIALVKVWFLPIIIPIIVRNDYIQSLSPKKSFEDFYHFFLRQLSENLKDYIRFFQNK